MPRNPDRVPLTRLADDIAKARTLDAKIKALEAQRTPIIAAIKKAMGPATFGTIAGKVVVEWTTSTRETLDAKTLREEQPAIAAKYSRITPVRTFRFKDPE